MKPESLLGISLELIETVALPGAYPADARVGRFFRARRFLGSRDRRFLGAAVYSWLRHGLRARARWRAWGSLRDAAVDDDDRLERLEEEIAVARASDGDGEEEVSASRAAGSLRSAYLLDLLALAREQLFPWSFEETVTAVRRRGLPAEAEGAWAALLGEATGSAFLADTPLPEDPVERLCVEGSLPRWLASALIEERGAERAGVLARELLRPASVDLRANIRRSDRQEIRAVLERETGQSVEFTPWSPLGLRLAERTNLTATTASRKSWIEVQDEGSQLAALCADAARGMTLIDACAGSGGKTLAFADLLFSDPDETEGRIFACDISEQKLLELSRRAREAEVGERIAIVPIYPAGPFPDALPAADVVFIDAPCTGLGTLRRNPELKRRWGPEDVASFGELQLSILERFAELVKPGGRLVYVTCSFLRRECDDVASAFEADHPRFRPEPSSWARDHLPAECIDGHGVRLDPALTRTDAFFIAGWRRSPE